MSIFTGSCVALVTPFNDDGSINFDKFIELLDYHLEHKTDAVLICGTTGEASTIDDKDQIECVRLAAKHINKRMPVIAGAGSNDTAHAVSLAKESEKAGADGLLIVTPYYNKTSQKGLIAHYTAIAEAVNIPIILYNVPGRTGMKIAPETCAELSKIPNIVAVKDATGDISSAAKTAALCGSSFDIYSGNDDQTLPILSLGGKGVISVTANIIPDEMHDICEAYFNGNHDKARQIQLDILGIFDAMFCDVNPMPVKEAMNILGYGVGPCKLPLVGISEEHIGYVKSELKKFGLLK
ncbi:MAG: 4-hydroxy-tetrahydrodipicolinate synthase [Clostridiales bacterium]|nr:MAG: 4-hydroxy-tetrahydrodipicolinate synthase [Clostridiales bacterium]